MNDGDADALRSLRSFPHHLWRRIEIRLARCCPNRLDSSHTLTCDTESTWERTEEWGKIGQRVQSPTRRTATTDSGPLNCFFCFLFVSFRYSLTSFDTCDKLAIQLSVIDHMLNIALLIDRLVDWLTDNKTHCILSSSSSAVTYSSWRVGDMHNVLPLFSVLCRSCCHTDV